MTSVFKIILGFASFLIRCSWIPEFYMNRLPIWPAQPSCYWVIRYPWVQLVVRLVADWLRNNGCRILRIYNTRIVDLWTALDLDHAWWKAMVEIYDATSVPRRCLRHWNSMRWRNTAGCLMPNSGGRTNTLLGFFGVREKSPGSQKV